MFCERTVYDCPWVRLTQVDVQAPDGRRWWHHVVRLSRVAVAVVIDDDDRVLMMWRHRFIPNRWGWELPGGIVDPDSDENGATAASREVEEETGWRPAALQHLATFDPMPGLVDTPHEVYLARGAVRVGEPTDAEEAAQIAWVPLADTFALAARGELLGAGTLVGLLWTLAAPSSGKSIDPSELSN